jgi:hypothetical protein
MKRDRPKGRTSSLDRRLELAGDLSVHAKIPIERLPMDYLFVQRRVLRRTRRHKSADHVPYCGLTIRRQGVADTL